MDSLHSLKLPPFAESLGIRQYALDGGEARGTVDLGTLCDSQTGNGYRGILATMLDVTMAAAIRLSVSDCEIVETLNLDLHYLKPGSGVLTAQAKALHVDGPVAVAYGKVVDAGGAVVVVGTGSFRVKVSNTDNWQSES